MLDELGSIASLIGIALSLAALGFALLQLHRLQGEAEAARKAAEEAQRLIKRDTTATDLTRLSEQIQSLIDLLHAGDRDRALQRFPGIRNLFIDIRRHHPNLNPDRRSQIQEAINALRYMQNDLERLEEGIPTEMRAKFIDELIEIQTTLLLELEDRLGKDDFGG